MSLIHQLALTFIKGVGPTLSRSLLSYFSSPQEVFEVSLNKLLQVPGIGAKTVQGMNREAALERAQQELEYIEQHNIDVIFYTDERYPRRLKNCNDAPVLLYRKGPADLNAQHVVSIVGTRNATDYGRELCRQLIDDLKQYPVLIVSGLAHGIDVAAHKESLRVDLPTVGVLGHGLDRLYPSQNRAVADRMLANGALLTEYPSGTKPDRENFPARNRIVAGMADVTVVVEAGIKGGALITAEIANSYNRDVFAFPGKITDEFSEGCNFLIRNNKAGLLTCTADLAFLMGWSSIGTKPKSAVQQFALPIDMTEDERQILALLHTNNAPVGIDELHVRLNMSVSQLAMHLLNMEMQGYLQSLPGKMYRIS